MHSERIWHCRVCGYGLDETPWGEDGMSPTYDFCPCCGVEFGYGDATIEGIKRWRSSWLKKGASWEDPSRRPFGWTRERQLALVPVEYK